MLTRVECRYFRRHGICGHKSARGKVGLTARQCLRVTGKRCKHMIRGGAIEQLRIF